MNQTTRLLTTISSTEPISFRDLCFDLGDDRPEKGDNAGWRELFESIEALEQCALVEVSRLNGRIDSLQLTDLGAERAREALRER